MFLIKKRGKEAAKLQARHLKQKINKLLKSF